MKKTIQSINKETFIISDLHLGHKNILQFEPCRKDAMEKDGFDNHEEWIIYNWNSVVKETDSVLVLGDFAFKGVQEYINRLNGNIIFILGNHDSAPKGDKWRNSKVIRGIWPDINDGYITRIYDDMMFEDVLLSGLVIDIDDTRYLMCHYDIFSDDDWDRRNKKIAPRIEYLRKVFDDFDCDMLIHGHVHSLNSKDKDRSINVCLEHIGFKPQKIKKFIKG